jgi:AraC-like DNA-binding protein
VTSAAAQHLRDLARLRRVRDRIDREYAQPLDVEALARGAHMSAGHLSREFRLAYGGSPYGYLMTGRIERAMAPLRRGDLSVTGHLQQSLHRPGRYAAQHLRALRGARNGGDAVVRGETGDQTGQESRWSSFSCGRAGLRRTANGEIAIRGDRAVDFPTSRSSSARQSRPDPRLQE